MRLGSAFIADLANHKTEDLKIEIPAMVFHGRADDIVPVDLSIGFAANNPSVTLHVLDDDHQLLSSVPLIWNMSREFLLSSPTKKC
jgi:pimeloyl-ACP methyl ester carboxylesterase